MTDKVINELIEKARSYQSQDDIDKILKAIEYSKKAHSSQFRKSGEPYYFHPIEVAKLLTDIKLDSSSIACGLLHDIVEDTTITTKEIEENWQKCFYL